MHPQLAFAPDTIELVSALIPHSSLVYASILAQNKSVEEMATSSLPTGFCSHSSFKPCLCKHPLAQNKCRNKPVEEIISSTDWFLLPFLIQALSMQASPGAKQVPQQASRRNHFFYRLVSAPIPHSSLVYASIPWQNKCRSKPVEDIISSTDWLRQLAMGSSFWRLGRKDMETQCSLRIPAGYTPQAGLGFHYRSFSLPATAAHLSCTHNPFPRVGLQLRCASVAGREKEWYCSENPILPVALGMCQLKICADR